MDKNSVDWHGAIPPLATPFDRKGKLDEVGFRKNVKISLEIGVTGLLVAGCTGEFWALTKNERKRLFEIAVEETNGKVPVIAGTGAITTPETIELTKIAKEAGADGVLILNPFFVKPSQREIIDHFQAVSDAVDIPICLYNIYSGNIMQPELIDKLADIKNVVAIKESSADFMTFCRILNLVGDKIRVFVGPATLFGGPALLMGAVGYIDTSVQYWGKESIELYEASKIPDLERIRAWQKKALKLRGLMFKDGRNMYVTVKAIMNLLGWCGGYPRLPLKPMPEEEIEELRKAIEELNIPSVG